MNIVPQVMQSFQPGAIVRYSWGYDQTNIDYFAIVKRRGDFVWLQPMNAIEVERDDAGMVGRVKPGAMRLEAPAIRRKVKRRGDEEIGFQIRDYGWAGLWEGEPDRISWYG